MCCFASDVDMCLWGVVECESPSAMAAAMSGNNGGDVFIGDDDAQDVDSDDDEWVEDLGVESTQVLSCKYSILQTNHDWHPIDSCSRVFH